VSNDNRKSWVNLGVEDWVKSLYDETQDAIRPIKVTYSHLFAKAHQALKDRMKDDPNFLFTDYPTAENTNIPEKMQESA